MESPAPPSLLKHLWMSTLLSGVLAIILGVLAWTWPTVTIIVTAIFFGAYLLITGITQVVFAFSLHVSAGGRVLLFISGAAALILALLCFRSLQESILLLSIWIGIGFIFRGVATAVSAISDSTLPGRGVGDLHRSTQPGGGHFHAGLAAGVPRNPHQGRRNLAHRHRSLRGRVGVRHPQSLERPRWHDVRTCDRSAGELTHTDFYYALS